MAGDASATKKRILEAAHEEFATHGLAGARIDRIALNSKASKERLYAYFGDKNALFFAVLDQDMTEFLGAIAFDPQDLPGFAVDLYDQMVAEPSIQRMMMWGQLQGHSDRMRQMTEAHECWERQRNVVLAAQADGIVDPSWDPSDLMTMIFGLVLGWVSAPGGDCNQCDAETLTHRREVIRLAVTRICAPR